MESKLKLVSVLCLLSGFAYVVAEMIARFG